MTSYDRGRGFKITRVFDAPPNLVFQAWTDPEYLDWGPGRQWETAVAEEVPAYVDAHFRTIRSRSARAIVGLSAGGYGAVLVALGQSRHL